MDGVRAAAAIDETWNQAAAMPMDNLGPQNLAPVCSHIVRSTGETRQATLCRYPSWLEGYVVSERSKQDTTKVGRRSDTNSQGINKTHNKEEAFVLSNSFHGSLDHKDELSWADS